MAGRGGDLLPVQQGNPSFTSRIAKHTVQSTDTRSHVVDADMGRGAPEI